MANVVNKIFVDKMGGRSTANFVGQNGDIFYDPTVGELRLSDGSTPGGKSLGGTQEVGVYRGFQAGANFFRNTNDQDIAQIIIHDSEARVDYINFTKNTDNDDFYVTGLIHTGQNGEDDWEAENVIVLNVYGNPSTLATSDIRNFVKKFIDVVLYNDNEERVPLELAKAAFYDNITALVQSLPDGSLFQNFVFDDYGRLHYPEYSSSSDNFSAGLKVFIDQGEESSIDPDYSYDSIAQMVFTSAGSGYSIGDVITVNGGQLGGIDETNDFTLTVTDLKSGNITGITMTSGGSNFVPGEWWDDVNDLSGGAGGGAQIHINSCDSNGAIVDFEIRNGGGSNYQVGDTLTFDMGGSGATFEVTSVGANGIDGWELTGTAYTGSPAKVPNGYWPKMNIDDGGDDQYDGGNWISTDSSSVAFTADIYGKKMIITNMIRPGTGLQSGQWITIRYPDGNGYDYAMLVGQATDDSNIWYLNRDIEVESAQVRADGINYGNGNVINDSQFGGGSYVTVYDQSIFAMMAFGTSCNSVYYNGEMGADGGGYKQIDILLGAHDDAFDSKLIAQNDQMNNYYTLNASDAGKHIYGAQEVIIPSASEVNFPIGTAITVVSQDNWCYIYANNSDITKVWGAGFDQTNNNFYIPNNSIATILKIGADKWMVSGAGLAID